MTPQYDIINQCMQVLKLSAIPPIKKLRIEIQLIQLKRHMLNENLPDEITCGVCSEEVLKAVLSQLKRISKAERGADEAVSDLMDSLGAIIDGISTGLCLES